MKKTRTLSILLTVASMLCFGLFSLAEAGTTQGAVVGAKDVGENNYAIVIKDTNGKKLEFDLNNYDEYKIWNEKANKGKKVIITWNVIGSGKYASKSANKIEVVESEKTSASPEKTKVVKILKISDFSEAADSISTDNGEYILQTYNNKYKKIKNKLKASIGKKVTLILDKEGDGLISDVK